jgi:hypothetical protein
LALLLGGAVLTAPSTLALSARRASEIRKAVTSVPVPEMPAKAAELVQHADKADRKEVAITAVRAVVSKRKASGPVVVAAISKVAPELAATAAAAASQLVADQSANISLAAIAAAPGQSEAILAAIANSFVQINGNQSVTSQPGAAQSNGSVATSVSTPSVPSASAISTVASVQNADRSSSPANVTEGVRPSVPAAPSLASTTAAAAPIARGEADLNGPSSGLIGHGTTPINRISGGRGDGIFPGFAPNRAPTPHPKDYSKPRS